MLLSKTIKFIFIMGLLILPASLARAETVSFNDQKWEVPVELTSLVDRQFARNDFSLLHLAQATLNGSSPNQKNRQLGQATLAGMEQVAKDINQQAINANLTISNNRAAQFNPGQSGQALDKYELRNLLVSDMTIIKLPVVVSMPKTTLASTNNLGINELVAIGESNFSGSPNNRIHNIKVGAAKYNGLIIKPGEEFSFNKYLGDVDAKHGFLPELVIKPGGVTPEFGGGLCQVSTTTFRAAMNAGLPITARRNHSFAVQYYAPQGTDATIYPGSADLKFINDLSGALLIRTRVEGRKLYFEFYGTKDARSITFDGPTQYDKKSDGSMKATWTRHVVLNGQTTDQTFKSTYLSPALFHRDTVTAPSTPNPEAAPTPPLTP